MHVLGTPPTFTLSQDQTLQFKKNSEEFLTKQFGKLDRFWSLRSLIQRSFSFYPEKETSILKNLTNKFLTKLGLYSESKYIIRVFL